MFMVEINAFGMLALFGATIVVGYIGSLIFSRTKIPDILWLLIFGLIIGPLLGLVDRGLFLAISPILAALAILLILFDAGLNMDFYQMVRSFSRSILLAVLGMILGIVSVGMFAVYVMGFDLLTGLLLGAMLGGTCSTTVIALIRRSEIKPNTKTFLSLETVFTDPLVIVISIALINVITQSTQYSATQGILGAFSIGAVIGLVSGLIWLYVLDKLKGKPFDYMLTLAILFILYVFVESSGGSGAIMALFFGLVLGNGRAFSSMLKFRKRFETDHLLKTFNAEVSFFIRSFFFVYLGLIVVINQQLIIYGVAIAAILIIMRFIAVQISTIRMGLAPVERNIARNLAPRGLAAAVLAQLPITYGIQNAQVFSDIIFIVILATVIYTTVAVKIASRTKKKHKEEHKENAKKD